MANRAIADLKSIPFSAIIGGPLSACVNAQRLAAQSTIDFITSIGMKTDSEGKPTNEIVNVSLLYKRDGQQVELTVPLLTIVPIPYIAIDTININFKAKLTGSTAFQHEYSKQNSQDIHVKDNNFDANPALWGSTDADGRERMEMTGSISSKKDSKSTQNSNYSVESTIDINVSAHSESMPAGMAKVLEMLNQAIMLQPTATTTDQPVPVVN